MMPSDETQIALIQQSVDNIAKQVDKIDQKLEGSFVTKIEFEPIKKFTYGLIGVILLEFITAIIAFFLFIPTR